MKILITGTTSGIGKALMHHYAGEGDSVIAVNRRHLPEQENLASAVRFAEIDIVKPSEVSKLFSDLENQNLVPDIFFLNAGINLPDLQKGLDLPKYSDVMATNWDGVLTFVGEAQRRGWIKKRFIAISSTSILVPNPAHVGYFASKLLIAKVFPLFQKQDPQNRYQTVVLGPAHTNIMSRYGKPQGLQGKIFDWLAVSPESVASRLAALAQTRKATLNYPTKAIWFYRVMKMVLAVFPKLYASRPSANPRFETEVPA